MSLILDILQKQASPIVISMYYQTVKDKILKKPCKKGWADFTHENYKNFIDDKTPLAVLTGEKTGYFVIDVDPPAMGIWSKWVAKYGEPDTLKVASRSGGIHYYFIYTPNLPEKFKKSSKQCFVYKDQPIAIDIRSNKGCIMIPCKYSRYKGADYKLLSNSDIKISKFPKWLLKKINPNNTSDTYTKENIPDEMKKLLGCEEDYIDLFYERYKEDIYVINSASNEMFIWNPDNCLWVNHKTKDILIAMVFEYLQGLADKYIKMFKDDKEMLSNLNDCKSFYFMMRNIKDLFIPLKKRFYNPSFENMINASPYILPIKNNKTLDLRTLELRNRRKTDYFSFSLDNITFDLNDPYISKIDEIMLQIMDSRQDMRTFLQRALGYGFLGINDARALFIFWGKGCNGKGMICEAIKKMLGNFYNVGSRNLFIKTKKEFGGSGPSSDIASLKGTRVCVFSETEKDDNLNEGFLKAVSGGDSISARALYKDQMSFQSTAVMYLQTNNRPKFDSNDKAFIDRLKYIPFSARFSHNPKQGEYQIDTTLKTKLSNEWLSAFFTWICIGARDYFDTKDFAIPEFAQKATTDYINELDNISEFVNSNCELSENNQIEKDELYSVYNKWCTSSLGQEPIIKKKFYADILSKYAKEGRGLNRSYIFKGIALKAEL